MFKNKESNNYLLTINGKKFAIDLEKVKEYCFSEKDKDSDIEITNTFETDENGELVMTGKLLREIKSNSESQNDVMVYDLIKMFIGRLLDNSEKIDDTNLDFSTSLAFNSMLKLGIIVEVE